MRIILCIYLVLHTALVDCLLRVFVFEATADVQETWLRRCEVEHINFPFFRNVEGGRAFQKMLLDLFPSSLLSLSEVVVKIRSAIPYYGKTTSLTVLYPPTSQSHGKTHVSVIIRRIRHKMLNVHWFFL